MYHYNSRLYSLLYKQNRIDLYKYSYIVQHYDKRMLYNKFQHRIDNGTLEYKLCIHFHSNHVY